MNEALLSIVIEAIGRYIVHFVLVTTIVSSIVAIAMALMSHWQSVLPFRLAAGALVVAMVAPVLTPGIGATANLLSTNETSAPTIGDEVDESVSDRRVGADPTEGLSALSETFMPSNRFLLYAYLGALLIWLVGALSHLVRVLGALVVLRRIRQRATAGPPRLSRMASDVARQIGTPDSVEVRVSPDVSVPMVQGGRVPVLLVPPDIQRRLEPDQVRMVFAHELAHVARRDYLVNVLVAVACALFFFHPAVKWLARLIRVGQEFRCDDAAMIVGDSRRRYVLAILTLVGIYPSATIAGLGNSSVLVRIRRLLDAEGQMRSLSKHLGARRAVLASVIVAGLAIVAEPGLASAVDGAWSRAAYQELGDRFNRVVLITVMGQMGLSPTGRPQPAAFDSRIVIEEYFPDSQSRTVLVATNGEFAVRQSMEEGQSNRTWLRDWHVEQFERFTLAEVLAQADSDGEGFSLRVRQIPGALLSVAKVPYSVAEGFQEARLSRWSLWLAKTPDATDEGRVIAAIAESFQLESAGVYTPRQATLTYSRLLRALRRLQAESG